VEEEGEKEEEGLREGATGEGWELTLADTFVVCSACNVQCYRRASSRVY
jgi:hypothetical protein